MLSGVTSCYRLWIEEFDLMRGLWSQNDYKIPIYYVSKEIVEIITQQELKIFSNFQWHLLWVVYAESRYQC